MASTVAACRLLRVCRLEVREGRSVVSHTLTNSTKANAPDVEWNQEFNLVVRVKGGGLGGATGVEWNREVQPHGASQGALPARAALGPVEWSAPPDCSSHPTQGTRVSPHQPLHGRRSVRTSFSTCSVVPACECSCRWTA